MNEEATSILFPSADIAAQRQPSAGNELETHVWPKLVEMKTVCASINPAIWIVPLADMATARQSFVGAELNPQVAPEFVEI